jgi:hypothetical protein
MTGVNLVNTISSIDKEILGLDILKKSSEGVIEKILTLESKINCLLADEIDLYKHALQYPTEEQGIYLRMTNILFENLPFHDVAETLEEDDNLFLYVLARFRLNEQKSLVGIGKRTNTKLINRFKNKKLEKQSSEKLSEIFSAIPFLQKIIYTNQLYDRDFRLDYCKKEYLF